jgi:cytochrome b6-f complex iron-sulfur subunit
MEDGIHRAVNDETCAVPLAGCVACMSRRDFIARSAFAAAALAALEACGDGQIGAPTTLTDGPFTIRLTDFPGLSTTGTLVDVSSSAPDRAVIRTGATTFAAFSRICTHQQCLTAVHNNRFECPCHGSVFRNDGAVVNGPAASPLLRLNVTVNADGTLTVA